MTRVIAIMQPTFLPWCGYMALMDRVDEFVLLDSVQFERRSWQQRNRIKGPNGVLWLTVPVISRGLREQRIDEVRTDRSRDFDRSAMRTLDSCYQRAPHYAAVRDRLVTPIGELPERLVDLTIPLLLALRDLLGIATPWVRSSSLSASGRKADLLVAICRERGADVYLSPPGSRGYLDGTDAFARAGIEVRYHEYDHPAYPQLWGAFVPYLSVVDMLANVGPRALDLIRSGVP